MAYIKMNIFSRSIMRAVPVTVLLPADRFPYPGIPEREEKPFKALYLLHGGYGSQNDYIYYTSIKSYAEAHDLALVIPGGDNLFFTDQKAVHSNYETFVGEELVRLMRRIFPLSKDREDTFLAGFSMGGYAALRIGLRYGGNFSRAAGLSPVTVVDGIREKDPMKLPEMLGGREFIDAVFGSADEFENSEFDLTWLAEEQVKRGAQLPGFYLSVGADDILAEDCVRLCSRFRDAGCDVTFHSGPGGHDWKFWDEELEHIIHEWLPVEPDIFEGLPGFMEKK